METTAEKLTYLNQTKSKLKDNINLTGAGLTNQTPFRQYATDLKTALLNILNNGTDVLFNNFPKTTGTGTNISLNNTLQAPMRSVINGDTEQNGTPTPSSPVAIQSVSGLQTINITGKNLFDKSTAIVGKNWNGETMAYSIATDYIKVEEGQTYVISTADMSEYSSTVVVRFDENKQVVNPAIRDNPFTIPTGTKYIKLSIRSATTHTWTQEELDNAKYQLELGNQPSFYETYQSQTKELNLGKNLFNANLLNNVSGIVVENNGKTIKMPIVASGNGLTSTGKKLKELCPTLQVGDVVYLSCTKTPDVYNKFIYLNYDTQWNYNSSKTITQEMLEATVNLYGNRANQGQTDQVILTDFQIEVGSQATSYSPYFTPIHLYEGDQIIGTPYNWSVKHVMGEVVLDGTNKSFESKHATISSETKGFYKTSLPNKNETYDNGSTGIAFSDYFSLVSGTANNAFNNNDNGMWWQKTGETVYFILEETSLTDANAWLQTHNTKVVYPLAEPTTEPITNTELISQLNAFYNAKSYNGQTNISVEGDLQMILDVSAIIDE